MTKEIKYTGTSDFQVFNKADFTSAGVETDKNMVVFPQGEPTEVDDAMADALTSGEGVFGDFSFEEVKDDDESEEDEADKNKGENDLDGDEIDTAPKEGDVEASSASDTTSEGGTSGTARGRSRGAAKKTAGGSTT